jgi:ergothioneine biosynthesis protein EgtB
MNTPTPAVAASPQVALAQRYRRIRDASLQLVAPLSAEDCQVQSMPDASPAKWHLAHVTWFFETFVLERYERGFVAFDPAFRVLFNSYYQGVGEQYPRPQRGLITRPTLETVKGYRASVDERLLALLAQPHEPELEALVTLGLHHEQQHQELLLTDVKHMLSFHPAHPAYARRWPIAAVQPQPLRWFGFDEGLFEVGHASEHDGDFCFDNETPRHRVWLDAFEIASRPVTYGEYLAFIDDGAYLRPELWLSMGWDWVRSDRRRAPLYWQQCGDVWHNHTLQGLVEIDARTPVCHLSYFEADAYARWAGARLPTEAEWERAARSLQRPVASAARGNFADRGAFHPLPAAQPSADEPVQMFGDVWEWTQSSYGAYPGYHPLPGAVGEYNGKFMCNQYVLRGGSCATPAGHVRASYRNFFPPDAQWQFTGLRLARDRTAS